MKVTSFSSKVLDIDCEYETEKITGRLREIAKKFRRRGAIIGVSGGIDSSVTAYLLVRAFGKNKVQALMMPEDHSADETLELSELVADELGIEKHHEDISGILTALGYYEKYNKTLGSIIPGYDGSWKSKIVSPNVFENAGYTVFSVVAVSPDGETVKERLPLSAYLEIIAATNFKQRVRKMLEYYYADLNNFLTIGTPNRLEYDQGFFVKLGDGASDIKPIAHLYKTQVYQMAAYLGVPDRICSRPPTTDTYSLPQGQDEFYFSLPYEKMDLCLFGKNNGISAHEISTTVNLTPEQVERVYKDIDQKRSTTEYLHSPPVLVEKIQEVGGYLL